uniref:NR LBD domain-containing protein n=1 Tax=Latimeria chalumnae TaxID=7897 RepID=H3A5U1_LATCH
WQTNSAYVVSTGIRKDRRGTRMLKQKRQKDDQDPKFDGMPSVNGPTFLWERLPIKNGNKNPLLDLMVDQVLSALLEAEPPVVYSEHDPKKPFTEASMMTLLTNLADKELLHMITWAKKIPGSNLRFISHLIY